MPVYSGCVAYFPLALAEVARLSRHGNDKHNPGQPLHWSRSKSSDHLDCIARHLLECGQVDDDGFLHDVKVAWRALANLQLKMEECGGDRGEDMYALSLARGQAALAWQGLIDNQDNKEVK